MSIHVKERSRTFYTKLSIHNWFYRICKVLEIFYLFQLPTLRFVFRSYLLLLLFEKISILGLVSSHFFPFYLFCSDFGFGCLYHFTIHSSLDTSHWCPVGFMIRFSLFCNFCFFFLLFSLFCIHDCKYMF